MSKREKLLIIGPIIDYGGREVMTKLWVHILRERYSVRVVSTDSMSKNSIAIDGLAQKQWTTLYRELYKRNFLLWFSANLAKYYFKRNLPAYYLIKNKISKTFYSIDKFTVKEFEKEVMKSDIVLYSSVITDNKLLWLNKLATKYDTNILYRITGKIHKPISLAERPDKIVFITHSKENFQKLRDFSISKIIYKDQTLFFEEKLLQLPIKEKNTLIYGYLGRFAKEKGILPLIKFFKKTDKQLFVAGKGVIEGEVLEITNQVKNIKILGEYDYDKIHHFFKKIDVLIIPSFYEGGPVVGLEAMAAGKLIVSTKVGAMKERLEQTGNEFWFSHNIENSLTKCLKNLESIKPYERIKIQKMLRKKYIKMYSREKSKEEYLKIFKDIS